MKTLPPNLAVWGLERGTRNVTGRIFALEKGTPTGRLAAAEAKPNCKIVSTP